MIAIFGAGIAGLTCALELIEKGFKVIIYEKDDLPGGMAKSKRINGIPSEHSWRGYANFYFNIFNLLERIPIKSENFSLDEVSKHNKPNDAWVTFRNNVYDITEFINNHPGGSIILKAIGKDLEDVWTENNVLWHINNPTVIKTLEKYKIGTLKEGFTQNTTKHNLYPNLQMKLYNNKITEKNEQIIYYDLMILFYHFSIFSLCNKRAEIYYNMKLLDYVNIKKISKYTYDYLINDILGPGLGLDKNTASLGHLFHFIHLCLGSNTPINKNWSVMKKPTSEAFINPLVNLLISKGVRFVYNCELIDIVHNKDKINLCIVKKDKKLFKVNADDYIISINPNYCYDIFKRSKMNNLADLHKSLEVSNIQISFRLGFKKKVNFSIDNIGIVLADSNYNITMYPQENFFTVPIDFNYKLKSLWSGTCVQIYNNGSIYNKPANLLTQKQLIEEIINQIIICKELQNDIFKNSGFKINKEDIVYSEIYDEWKWNGTELITKNKKWVNNYFNEQFKPKQVTEYNNLFLSGGHTKTSIRILSMESACESGKITANHILKKYNKKKSFIYKHVKPYYFSAFENIDDFLFFNKFPNILIVFFIILVLFLLVFNKNN
jgi:cytochrome b involved in lipid metabolism